MSRRKSATVATGKGKSGTSDFMKPKPSRKTKCAQPHRLQRLVSRWRKEAKKMRRNAALWGRDKKATMRKELAIEWSIGLAQAFTQCADELEAANDRDQRPADEPKA